MRPHLNFFCELETPELEATLADGKVLQVLQKLGAGVCLSTTDFSPQKAALVKRFEQAGIPIKAWLLLPREDGYWSNLDNFDATRARYVAFKKWTVEYGLSWEAVGLDIEPDIRMVQAFFEKQWRGISTALFKSFAFSRWSNANRGYIQLVENIRADGFVLETYQLPLIVDDRMAHTTFIQRLLGILNLSSDREVLMLYSSFLRPWGSGLIWSYGKEGNPIAVGSTGGGVELPGPFDEPLTWDELQRDLRLAWHWSDEIFIFSLEGCVQQGYLSKLVTFEWDHIILEPGSRAARVDHWRMSLRFTLWLVKYFFVFVILGVAAMLILRPIRRRE
jgi:hypothetical protein